MEDTCRGESCWFYKLIHDLNGKGHGLDFQDCPFYVESIWTPDPLGNNTSIPKVIKDCSNKRSLLALLYQVYPGVLSMQKAHEQSRNNTEKTANKFLEIIQTIKRPIGTHPRHELISDFDKTSSNLSIEDLTEKKED